MQLKNFISNRKFYDDENFSYGFARSGDFSKREAELLSNCGYIMQQLKSNKIKPENEEQEHFVLVMQGKAEALYESEHLFLKYLKLIDKKVKFFNPAQGTEKVKKVVPIDDDGDPAIPSIDDELEEDEELDYLP